MKVLVLGGGVIGVTAAYYLCEAGHEVEVVDHQPGPGLETSYANAGEISPGNAAPWAGPGMPLTAMRWLFMRHGPLVVRPRLDWAQWRFLWRFVRNCTSKRYAINKARMVPLAEFSRDCLRAIRTETGIKYDERTRGTLQLFRTQEQLSHSERDVAVLGQFGVSCEILDPGECVAAEPALARVREKIAGGLRLPDDETGDCRMFTEGLSRLAKARGAKFRFSTEVERINTTDDRVTGVITSAGVLTADAYMVALGSYTPLLLNPIGIDIPVYPVKGYSLTIPISDAEAAPVSTVVDETYKIAITRLGDRIRVGGTVEISGYDLSLPVDRRESLEQSVGDLFPDGGKLSKGAFWCGLRPMTPDGPPIIGRSRFRNLYLDTGHGTLGWTMACGSGRIVADLVSGKAPAIDLTGLGYERYGG